MGPTNRILSISPDVNNPAFRNMTFDELREAFKEQARGLIDGGCDLLLLETIVDTLNAKAGIVAIEEVFEEKGVRLPLMISVTITDRSGRTLSGQTIDAFWVSIAHARPFSVGVNCALGARDMRQYVAELARIADCYITCYPNAGLPNAFGEYDEQPRGHRVRAARIRVERLREHRRRLLRHDARSHPTDRRRRCEGLAPRPVQKSSEATEATEAADPEAQFTQFAGLEVLTIRPDSNFQMIGERTNVTGSAKFARLIRAEQLRRGDDRGARSGARRRQPDRREHGRGHARLRAGDDRLPQLHRAPSRKSPACR